MKDYEKWNFRFVSEFGMQSYNSPATQATFCPPATATSSGRRWRTTRRTERGNQVILDYVSRQVPFPRDQESLIYLSQLNQVHCMQTGVGALSPSDAALHGRPLLAAQ